MQTLLHKSAAKCGGANPATAGGQAGFTYIGLLITLALMALVISATVQAGAMLQRRMAEEELLQIGKEYRAALQSYSNATPAGQKRYPPSFKELLKDPRFPHTVRHLRRVYNDPLSGKDEWGIVEPEGGHGILAVYSLAEGRPIKIGNFEAIWVGFDAADSYQRWRFGVNQNPLPPKSGDGASGVPPKDSGGKDLPKMPPTSESGIIAPPDPPRQPGQL
ncbi:type II secretion system protein [Massilia sp. W12]|uniref:type II secretion system protein n=1 Tax=Massilia sp. W12 TaxID=3126507 RepID=UPI0030D55668